MKNLIEKAVKNKPPKYLQSYGAYYEPYYYLMYLLAKQRKNELAVELGVHKGRGSGALALGGMDVLAIDHTYELELQPVLDRFNNIRIFRVLSR